MKKRMKVAESGGGGVRERIHFSSGYAAAVTVSC